MGIVLDSTVFIAGERARLRVTDVVDTVRKAFDDPELILSAMSAAELIHGIWRARSPEVRARREDFVEEILARIPVRSITLRTARIAGQLDALARTKGVTIPTADLLIGSTAVELSFAVATHNPRHFRLIPKLRVHRLK